jgi:mevalonate kinase
LRKGVAVAPGKVIISGEHFVVHGATALAAAIQERNVRVEAARADALRIVVVDSQRTVGDDQLRPIRKVVEWLYDTRRGEEERPGGGAPRVSISIASTLAQGSGLGSSAAAMVATAGAVCALEGWATDIGTLVRAANEGERLVHGNPSGVDVTVSAMGGVILFKRGEEPRRVDLPKPLSLLVVFSGRKRSTRRLITKVATLKGAFPNLFASLCESATLVSGLCAEAVAEGDAASLGALMTYNHAVLSRVGASNGVLDGLVDLCLGLGCLGAKLTGAGGGGSVVAVPPTSPDEATWIREKIASKGYKSFLADIPSGGARAWTE